MRPTNYWGNMGGPQSPQPCMCTAPVGVICTLVGGLGTRCRRGKRQNRIWVLLQMWSCDTFSRFPALLHHAIQCRATQPLPQASGWPFGLQRQEDLQATARPGPPTAHDAVVEGDVHVGKAEGILSCAARVLQIPCFVVLAGGAHACHTLGSARADTTGGAGRTDLRPAQQLQAGGHVAGLG